jgi:hypothetical protein
VIDWLIDHLWQSTLFALGAALLTLAFRKNGAKVRFFIWFAASVKFLIPFSVFVWLGEHLRWETAPSFRSDFGSSILGQIAQPAAVVTSNFAGPASGSATFQWGWNT